MDLKKFNFIKNKYGLHASWAIWGKQGDKPKSNMDDINFFDNEEVLLKLKPNIVLVGLNFSIDGVVLKPFQNFHGSGGGAYKIRFALYDTSFWGAYMTDIIKDFPEKESSNVMSFLKNNPSLVDNNIISFEQELKDIGSVDPLLVCFGNDSYDILKKNLASKFKIIKVTHYSHYESKEKFREKMLKIIEENMSS